MASPELSAKLLALNLYSRLTIRQRPVIRLHIEVDFDQLTPSSRSNSVPHVSKISWPSIDVDSRSQHLGMDKIKVVGLPGKSVLARSGLLVTYGGFKRLPTSGSSRLLGGIGFLVFRQVSLMG